MLSPLRRSLFFCVLASAVVCIGAGVQSARLFVATCVNAPIFARLLPMDATVVSSRIGATSAAGHPARTSEIEFAYEVDGTSYRSSVVSLVPPLFVTKRQLVNRYPQGMRTTAFYDPLAPETSVLQRTYSPALPVMALGFSVIFAGCGWFVALIWPFWDVGRLPPKETRTTPRPGLMRAVLLLLWIAVVAVQATILTGLFIAFVLPMGGYSFAVAPLCYWGVAAASAPVVVGRTAGVIAVSGLSIDSVSTNSGDIQVTVRFRSAHTPRVVSARLSCCREKSARVGVEELYGHSEVDWVRVTGDDEIVALRAIFPKPSGETVAAVEAKSATWMITLRLSVGMGRIRHWARARLI